MAGMGFFAAVGHGLLIMAHQRAPASVLTPFSYTQLVWMILSGLLVFGDRPSGAVLSGAQHRRRLRALSDLARAGAARLTAQAGPRRRTIIFIPFAGRNVTRATGETTWPGASSNRNAPRRWPSTIVISSIAKPMPMQTRGPAPNGI